MGLTEIVVGLGALFGKLMEDSGSVSAIAAWMTDKLGPGHAILAVAGTLDTLPHNGAVVTLLAVCGSTHRESYLHILMTGIVGPNLALAIVVALGSFFGSF